MKRRRRGDFKDGLTALGAVVVLLIMVAVVFYFANGSKDTFKKVNKRSSEAAMSLFE